MAAKSSANENKENAKVLPSHGKAWKSGRGEVSHFKRELPKRSPFFCQDRSVLFCVASVRAFPVAVRKPHTWPSVRVPNFKATFALESRPVLVNQPEVLLAEGTLEIGHLNLNSIQN